MLDLFGEIRVRLDCRILNLADCLFEDVVPVRRHDLPEVVCGVVQRGLVILLGGLFRLEGVLVLVLVLFVQFRGLLEMCVLLIRQIPEED